MTKYRAWNSTLPAPSKQLERRTPLRSVNPTRAKARREDPEVFGPFYSWLKRHEVCCVYMDGCRGPLEGHHLRTRGSGGKDARNLVPLCLAHHTEVHTSRERFEAKYGVDLDEVARETWEAYRGTR